MYRCFAQLACMALISLTGCYYDKEELLYPGGNNCPTAAVSFAGEVRPLMQSKCAYSSECHGTGAFNAGGPLTTYDQVKSKVTAVRHQVVTGLMPKNGSLSSAELRTIVCWIDSGSPNN